MTTAAAKKTLNQIVAIEKQVKSRIYAEQTAIHKELQKPDLLNGFIKRYKAKEEAGEVFPDESKQVQVNAQDRFTHVTNILVELFDLEATKDASNGKARADIVVDGKVLVFGVPATTLLFLEKQFTDLHTMIAACPVLDPADTWTRDENSRLFRSEMTETVRTKKVAKPIVLYPATPEHPAQTQLISEDVPAGIWQYTKLSGALPLPEKMRLLDRVNALGKAVKEAREKANMSEIEDLKIGRSLMDFMLS